MKTLINYIHISKIIHKNFTLIIVTEQKYKDRIQLKKENLIIETVEKYSPEEDVTNKHKGDSAGWKKIYKNIDLQSC